MGKKTTTPSASSTTEEDELRVRVASLTRKLEAKNDELRALGSLNDALQHDNKAANARLEALEASAAARGGSRFPSHPIHLFARVALYMTGA